MIDEEFEEVLEEASKQYRQYQRGGRGQTVTYWDTLDYWVYTVTKEKYGKEVK